MSRQSRKIGIESENKILRLLQTRNLPQWITGPIWKTKSSDVDDQKGIDIWVQTIKGRIPLQVKSRAGTRGGKRSRRKNFYSRKGIAYIACKTGTGQVKNEDLLFDQIIQELRNFIER